MTPIQTPATKEEAFAGYNRRHAEIVDAHRRAGWTREDAIVAADKNGYVNDALNKAMEDGE